MRGLGLDIRADATLQGDVDADDVLAWDDVALSPSQDDDEDIKEQGVASEDGIRDQLGADGLDVSPMRDMPLPSWVERLVSQVCSARTRFSSFVKAYISSCRRGRLHTSPTTLFPIPAPDLSVWLDGPARKSQSKRMHVAYVKMLHLVVAALNFQFFQNPFEITDLCRRRPGPQHAQLYARLLAHIKVCGCSGSVSVSGCGRKSFQLSARLEELLKCVQSLGLDVRGPYNDAGPPKASVPRDDTVAEELRPYRSLNADRLKLSGCGQWKCEEYLPDLLYMPFMEPRCNVYDVPLEDGDAPDNSRNDYDQMLKLVRVWDVNGLVDFLPLSEAPKDIRCCTRVFNNYKDETKDRQIGDRRGQNKIEGKIQCGSETLPTAQSLLQLSPIRWRELLCCSITDRKDFYHQFAVSWEKRSLNAIYPWPLLSEVKDVRASARFVENFMVKKKKADREVGGDHLGGYKKPLLISGDPQVVPCFNALFQGDHLGVEFATAAHSCLLQQHGLLRTGARLLNGVPIFQDVVNDGLVIDDYFCLSREEVSRGDPSGHVRGSHSEQALGISKRTYEQEGIRGSDEKDIVGSLRYKVIGAEVDSSLASVSRGIISLGAPSSKRLGLAMLSATLANQGYTSDALHACLVGSWSSVLLFRRPLMSVMDSLYKVIPPDQLCTEEPSLWFLSRDAAQELLLLACLAPVMSANLSVPFSNTVYAPDASLAKGGFCIAEVDEVLAKALWRSADKKGANLPLLRSSSLPLLLHDECYEELGEEWAEDGAQGIPRPLGLWYEFIEVCGGAGVVTAELIKLAVVCGPVLDISVSQQYNLTSLRVIQWLLFMLEERRLLSFLAAPPCTTFSPAAFPPLRSYRQPMGFDVHHPRVLLGNQLSFSSLALVVAALRYEAFGLAETPLRSKMRWLPHWRRAISLGAREVHLASCAYGSIHEKKFCFLGAGMKVELLGRKCPRNHTHVRIQGSFTKSSAVYCHGLAVSLARFFKDHLLARRSAEERLEVNTDGLEDVVTNDLCQTLDWRVGESWRWKFPSHINALETSAIYRALAHAARRGGDQRVVYFSDSHVAKSSVVRGRTSSDLLRPLLRRISSLVVAYGLYPAGRYAPTRLNPGDCPTRDIPVPLPVPHSVAGSNGFYPSWIFGLSSGRRWISNWLRLTLLLLPQLPDFDSSDCWRKSAKLPISLHEWDLDFDSTLGFPGEGPLLFVPLSLFQLVAVLVAVPAAFAAPRVPGSHGDMLRQRLREGLKLPDGRRVTEATGLSREGLLHQFQNWLTGKGVSFDTVFLANFPVIDEINKLLCEYGRSLFHSGKPYYRYAETINAVASKRPTLRRSLQQAWDLAFMWCSFEPTEHHTAMPFQVLLAVLSTCLVWGWRREAGIFALSWGALLRIGEVFHAVRGDLVFPGDVSQSIDHILIKIKDPKTRYRAARHQSSKLEQPDLIKVAEIGLFGLRKSEKLWNLSGSTLRSRLSKVLQRLDLPFETGAIPRPLTLASLRGGGATWLIAQTENAEMTRRRGRWVSMKVMEVYLQEISASTFLNDVSTTAKTKTLQAMHVFPEMLQKVEAFYRSRIPEATWFFLLHKAYGKQPCQVGVGEMG